MAMRKESVELEIIHMLIDIDDSKDDIEVKRLTKDLIKILKNVVHDKNLDGSKNDITGMQILAKFLCGLL